MMDYMKKPFKTPLVLQSVVVLLEQDFLQGASSMGSVQSTGHEVEETDAFVNTAWD